MKTTNWDRERLRMLVIRLSHTNAMPLLLSLSTLDEKIFSEALVSIERFVFRYKTIGNVHIGRMAQLYLRFSKEIREVGKVSLRKLRSDLHSLVMEVMPDSVFRASLEKVRYAPRSGNGEIRYFLITLEDFFRWYEEGAQGTPKCRDKTRVFDFSNTTVEHLYPQAAKENEKDAALESVKNNLGNLTILGPNDNAKMKNRPFGEKRASLAESNVRLNREIAAREGWSSNEVSVRTEELVDMALKVFVP